MPRTQPGTRPRTRQEHRRSLDNPAVSELLNIRDLLDNVMVRTDGSYVAAFRVQGARTYFADDHGRNETKSLLEALLRAVPEESMRLQCRFEVMESLHGLLARYDDQRRTHREESLVLEQHRVAQWREREAYGEYLTRLTGVYLIWDAEKHRRILSASGGQDPSKNKKKVPVSPCRGTIASSARARSTWTRCGSLNRSLRGSSPPCKARDLAPNG